MGRGEVSRKRQRNVSPSRLFALLPKSANRACPLIAPGISAFIRSVKPISTTSAFRFRLVGFQSRRCWLWPMWPTNIGSWRNAAHRVAESADSQYSVRIYSMRRSQPFERRAWIARPVQFCAARLPAQEIADANTLRLTPRHTPSNWPICWMRASRSSSPSICT